MMLRVRLNGLKERRTRFNEWCKVHPAYDALIFAAIFPVCSLIAFCIFGPKSFNFFLTFIEPLFAFPVKYSVNLSRMRRSQVKLG